MNLGASLAKLNLRSLVGPSRPAVGRGPRGVGYVAFALFGNAVPSAFPLHTRGSLCAYASLYAAGHKCAAALVMLTFSTRAAGRAEAVIKGKITSETGEPLGGANIVVANTNLGAVTAANGTYTLTIGATAVHGQAAS